MSASKVVNIVTSLISMLSNFGEKSIVFNEIMIMFTEIGMSVICIYMIIKSTEWLQSN